MNKQSNESNKLEGLIEKVPVIKHLIVSENETIITNVVIMIFAAISFFTSTEGFISNIVGCLIGWPITYLVLYLFCRLFWICSWVIGLLIKAPGLNMIISAFVTFGAIIEGGVALEKVLHIPPVIIVGAGVFIGFSLLALQLANMATNKEV